MSKLELLKEMVQKNGSEEMKELMIIVENYIEGLNHIFEDREVTQFVLKEFDFPMFLKELGEKGVFQNKVGIQSKLLVMNVFFITRHVWEFVDKYGEKKTGDDLRKAWPLMYEDDSMLDIESLFKQMKNL